MTVDTEAIFALVDALGPCERRWKSCAARCRLPGSTSGAEHGLHRARRRPAALARRGEAEAFFASTKHALEVVERYLDLKLRKRELPEGILVPLVDGRRQQAVRFSPDRAYEETPLPAVRAPHEGARCLRRLALIAAAA